MEHGADYVVDYFNLKSVTELRPDTLRHIGEHVERELEAKGIIPTVGGAKQYLDGLAKKLRITEHSDPYFVTNVLYSYFTNPRGPRTGIPTKTVEMLSKHIEWLQGLLDRSYGGPKEKV